MLNRKYFPRLHKKDTVTPLQTKYLLRLNDGDLLEFDNKLDLARYLTEYRTKYNEIQNIEMFKMELFNLIKL